MIKNVLIVENSLNGLKKINESVTKSGKRQYILGGIFTEFGIKNRNDRIYQADKFLPHLKELLERKTTLGAVYGEFDHPDVFDTSLARVSHTVESAFFVKEHNRVDGEIKLLNTHWGKEAQALIDDGCPIFVSSRAAGITESNGEVTIKKLFTYDAVADPGFSSAKMELRTVNEKLGYIEEGANFRIYDISDESKINDLFNMDKNEFVTKEQMEKYSSYLTDQITKTKSEINEALAKGDFDPGKLNDLFEKYDSYEEGFKKIASYLDYLAETMQVLVKENKKIKRSNENLEEELGRTKAKTDKIVEHNDYLAGELEKAINYSEYVAEQVDKSIDYQNYIAETLDKSIDFSEYIAENVDNTIKYSEYIAESLDKSIDYSEYVAENLEKNIAYAEYIAEHVDNNIKYAEYIAEHVDNNIKYAEYIAEHVDNSIKYTEYVGEQLDNSIKYAEYIAENLTDNIAYGNYLAEAIDKNIEYNKYIAEKLNSKGVGMIKEELESPEARMGNFKTDSVAKYYDEDDDMDDMTQAQPQSQGQAQVQPGIQSQAQGQPSQGLEDGEEDEESLDIDGVNAEEIQDVEDKTELTPGQVVKIDDDKTGEILAMNADNGIAVVKLSDTGEVQEIQESRLSIIGDKIFDSENKLKKLILKQINEAKKQQASKETEPHFLLFLSEKKKAAYYNLSQGDKNKVIVAMNESKGYTSEPEVLTIMAKALTTAERSFNEKLIDNIPSDLRPIWESLNPEVQGSIISSAQFYTSLTEDKMESFWNSRNLHEYAKKNMGKVTLLKESNNSYDNTKLTDSQLDAYLKKLHQR